MEIQAKESNVTSFDPNGPGIRNHLFGLPHDPGNASMIIVPVPWEVTVSYHSGTANGPAAILEASSQIDLFVKDIPEAWRMGISMLPIPVELMKESARLRELAVQHVSRIERSESIETPDPLLSKINEACENLNIYVRTVTQKLLKEGKLVGLVGGDHSTPLGFMRTLGERYDRFGILQIDAHADLRKAYQGFTYSHASIMYNALKLPSVSRLVQIGIRDFCEEEMRVIERAKGRVVTFFDEDIKEQQYRGRSWEELCDHIIKPLPNYVYVSFDIDGLDPRLCPGTGTPVAGGFEFHQISFLLKRLVRSGKKIIGFDLNEVAPTNHTDWDANVGARMLFQLCNWTGVSQNKLKMTAISH